MVHHAPQGIDLAKAFDTHNILVSKLEYAGTRN